jgi:ATP-dependent protease ClpP protease subunit
VSYCYTINAYSANPIIQINQHIGNDPDYVDSNGNLIIGEGKGICGIELSREIFEIDCLQPDLLTTYFNSQGGDVKDGFDYFNAILNAKNKTKSIISGFCYSTAGWMALASDTVEMYDYASWMCHLPFDPKDPTKSSPFLEMVFNSVATIISQKSGKNGVEKLSVDAVKEMMQTKTFLDAEAMFRKGLIDKIIQTGKNRSVKLDLNNSIEVKNQYKEFQTALNKLIQDNIKTSDMAFNHDKVVNYLKLDNGSGEDSVIAEIARRQNEFNAVNAEKLSLNEKLVAANKALETAQAQISEKQTAINELNVKVSEKDVAINKLQTEKDTLSAKNTELQTSVDASNKEKEDASAKLILEKATNMIETAIVAGKIPEKNKAGWIKLAVSNYEGIELQLDSMPASFKAPVVVGSNTVVNDAKPGTLQFYIAQNKEKIDQRETLRKTLIEQAAQATK